MVTSPLKSTMVGSQLLLPRLGLNCLPGLLPWASSGECLKPQQPQLLWPRCKGERKVSHMFPHAQVLRETEWKRREEERKCRTDTHSLSGPFKCFLTTKALHHCPPHLNCQERSFSGGRRVWCHDPTHTQGVLRGCSAKAPPATHPHSRITSWPALSSVFLVYPEQIPQMKVLFLVGGEGGAGAGPQGPGSQHSFALSGKKISRHR